MQRFVGLSLWFSIQYMSKKCPAIHSMRVQKIPIFFRCDLAALELLI